MKKKYPHVIKDFQKPRQYPDPDKKHPAQLAWEFLRRNPKYQADFDRFKKLKTHLAKWNLCQKWLPGLGLFKLFDPKDNSPRLIKFALTHAPRFHVPGGKGLSSIECLHKGDVFVTFNLNVPLKRQLEKARKFLEKERANQNIEAIEKNPQKHLFPHYWRLLDARAKGETTRKIAEYFYEDKKDFKWKDYEGKIKAEVKKANLLRDSDYVFIADAP